MGGQVAGYSGDQNPGVGYGPLSTWHAGGLRAHYNHVWRLTVTHVVSGVDGQGFAKRTIKCLWGVLTGRWVVNYNCMLVTPGVGFGYRFTRVEVAGVKESVAKGRWVKEDAFEVAGEGPTKGRANRIEQVRATHRGALATMITDQRTPTPHSGHCCSKAATLRSAESLRP